MEPFPFSSFFLFILFSGATKPLWSQEDAVWRDIDQERHAGGSAERQRVSADFERQPIVTTSCRSRSKILQNGSKWINMWTKHKKRMGRSKGTGRTLVFDIFWHLLDVLDMLGHAWPCSFFGLFSTWRATLNIMKPTKPRPLAVSFPLCCSGSRWVLPAWKSQRRRFESKLGWEMGLGHRTFCRAIAWETSLQRAAWLYAEQLFNPKWLETR